MIYTHQPYPSVNTVTLTEKLDYTCTQLSSKISSKSLQFGFVTCKNKVNIRLEIAMNFARCFFFYLIFFPYYIQCLGCCTLSYGTFLLYIYSLHLSSFHLWVKSIQFAKFLILYNNGYYSLLHILARFYLSIDNYEIFLFSY